LQKSASSVQVRYRPWAQSITADDDDGERSCVIVNPKHPVPRKPMLKPMDHWDLIVAFDAEKHRQEEEHYVKAGKFAEQGRFRKTLDGQMDELRGLREEEAYNKRKEASDMQAQLVENKRIEDAEFEKEERQKNMMKKVNGEMTAGLEKRRKAEKARRDKEQDDVTSWLNGEKARKKQEEEEQAVEYARKCKQAKDNLETARVEGIAKKKATQEEEARMTAAAQKAMDNAEAGGRKAVMDRMNRMDAIGKTFGAALQKKHNDEVDRFEAEIKRITEEGERMAKEDAERRSNEHAARVKDMLETLNKQKADNLAKGEVDKIANGKQAEIWKQQLADGKRKEAAEQEKRRQAREDQDKQLIGQIRETTCVHPLQQGLTPHIQRKELAFNRAIFEQMAADRFHEGLMGSMLASDTGTSGKLDRFKSVGANQGPKYDHHELELEEPDVC